MTSATPRNGIPHDLLRPGGSTRAWRKLRAQYGATLPQPCARCGGTVAPGDDWVLGHVVDRSLGGTADGGVQVEHRHCSSVSGGKSAHAGSRRLPGPSRDW